MIETNLPILYLREVVLLPFNEIRLEFTEDKEKNGPRSAWKKWQTVSRTQIRKLLQGIRKLRLLQLELHQILLCLDPWHFASPYALKSSLVFVSYICAISVS